MTSLFVLLSGGENPIDLDGSFFIQLLIFLLAFFLLRQLVFKPMMSLFAAREAAIEGSRQEAREMETDAKVKAAAFDEEMRKVKAQVADERDKVRSEAMKTEREILEKTRLETQRTLQESEKRLGDEATRVRAEMRAQTASLAKQIAARLLGREVQ